MARILTGNEKNIYIENRDRLLEELQQLQADFEDLSDREIIECRECILERINVCLKAVLEEDEDNMR